ncbi:MAG: prephenate dehydratase [Actinomycetota bacterium]
MRVAYLGPEGTFTEEAMLRHAPEAEGVPCVDVPSALDLVRMGEVAHAVVPIENSVEGGVNATLDTLAHGSPLMIVGEVLVPITFSLVARPGTALEDVRTVGTHPHGWAQCRRWMHDNLPDAVHVPTTSTAASAAELATGEAEYDAGLCSRISAERYQLEVLAESIADNWHAITRFVVVSTPRRLPKPTGADKTTLMVHLAHNEAGGLLDMLEQFAVRGVNLSRIESRPIGDSLGRYGFSIDAEGHVTEERMQAVLIGLHRVCPLVRFMGSYPSAEGPTTRLRPGTSDADFIAARTWVRSLLDS